MKYDIKKRSRTTRIWLNDMRYQFWKDIVEISNKIGDFAYSRMHNAAKKRFGVLKEAVIDCSDSLRDDVKKICDQVSL